MQAQRADRAGSDGSAGWTHALCEPISGIDRKRMSCQDLFARRVSFRAYIGDFSLTHGQGISGAMGTVDLSGVYFALLGISTR
ncbi:MAG: hypothetical protein LUO93_03810 [Methanomicrobiales archaeon]|nr:hypothetical protein [Methanomicrobiales archaeon]